MAEYSGYFNSVGSDRLYGADEMARFYSVIAKNGLYNVGNGGAYPYTAATGLSFTVGVGYSVHDGYFHVNDSPLTFFLSQTSGGNNRIDLLVLRVDKTSAERRVRLMVLQGNAAVSPSEPPLSNTSTTKDYAIYRFYVPSGAANMASVTRTDRRSYSPNVQAQNFMNPIPNAASINTLYEQGTYYVETSATLTDLPTDQNAIVEVFRDQSGKTFQRVTEINTGSTARNTIFQRASTTSGTWQGWTATYSDRQIVFDFSFVGGATASGEAKYAIIGDRVRFETIVNLPSGMAAGTTIATLTASARPSKLTYLAPIFANNGQRITIAIQPTGQVQVGQSITSNTALTIYGDFLLIPLRA